MPDNTTTNTANTDSEKKELEQQKAHKSLTDTLRFGLIAGGAVTLGYPFTIGSIEPKLIFVCLLIAFAAFISGYFLGNLFGMPKRNNAQDSNYALNNSLVEISEWLTKIIVGLGLINLKEIPGYLKNFGAFVKETTGVADSSVNIFSISILVFFSVFGLYIGYNYMRLVLSRQYKTEDDNLLAELEKAKGAQQKAEEERLKEEEKRKQAEEEKLKAETGQQQAEQEKLKAEAERQEAKETAIKIMDKANREQAAGMMPEAVAPETPKAMEAELEDTRNTRLFQNENILNNLEQMKDAAMKKLANGLKVNVESNDPQKGQWGGNSTNNNRVLKAGYEEISDGAYHITLSVQSTDPVQFPLKDNELVLLALHPTFGDPPFRILYAKDGKASINFFCYGSFTAGAFVGDTHTELELDLAELPGVSEYFKTH